MSNNTNRPSNQNKPLNRGPKFGSGLIFYAILIIGLLFFSTFVYGKNTGSKVEASLAKVYEVIENPYCDVTSVEIEGSIITMEYTNAQAKTSYITQRIPSIYVDNLIERLDNYKSQGLIDDYNYIEPVNWDIILSILSTVVLGAIIIFFFLSLTRQSKDSNSVFSFGNSRAKLTSPNEMKVKFADVAGSKEEKEELSEIVDFLKNPKKYQELGAKIPKGALLYGAPGTGKTLLARAVAGEAGVPFFYISGSDFVEMLVGVGASRVRSLFSDAKKAAPAVIFIDEIDAVGRKRGAGLGGGQDEREQTLNQILVEMDGFDVNTNVIVMAATNRVDVLDPALLRPGRFDRRIMVNPPDSDEREAILKIHAKNKPLDKDVSLREVALSTVGFTGADLQNLLNEAALLAARRNKKKISALEISDSMFRVMMGPEKNSRKLSDRVKRLTAYHEAGHAIVLRATSDYEKVDRVTIIPAGQAGGFTAYKPKEDLDYYTEKMLLDSIKMSLGGRAAEEIFLGEISTGASSDLQHCNRIATNMIKRYGLSPKFKNMVFGDENEEVFVGGSFGQVQSYSDATAAEIDREIQRIIDECYEETKRILIEKKNIVEGLSNRLIEVLKVDSPEFEAIYDADGNLDIAKQILEEQRKADAQKRAKEDEAKAVAEEKKDKTEEDEASKETEELTETQAVIKEEVEAFTSILDAEFGEIKIDDLDDDKKS
ncbi:MAG: ATP-dependent zinc metalloprotease FtsH [Saccharofermentans sp.]|nr:ATP-dependent zinc metalloprotease FtsH [Saccharofermentans sp.]